MQIPISAKHSASDTTIFSVMSALAQEHDAINLSQGFPDFPIDPQLAELLHDASQRGFNQYAPTTGLPILREAISLDFKNRYQLYIDPVDEITVTPGATYAIYTAFSTILSPGDEVIILEPAYDSYLPNIEMNGAKAVTVKLTSETYAPDWQAIRDAISPRTKAIIANTPHNPTGAIWTKADWEQLAEILRPTNIFVLSDEVYEQLVYDGHKHCSVLQHPELRARSFVLFSFGKAYHNTGWKMGYCIAPVELSKAFRRLHQFITFSVNTPAQYALAHFLKQNETNDATALLENKRNYFLQLMAETPFKILKPSLGSYFQLASYAHLSDMPDTEYAAMLTRDYGVATIPISAFYKDQHDDKILRFCFAKKEETLEAAVSKLKMLKGN